MIASESVGSATTGMTLRTMERDDVSEVAELIYGSLNTWHQMHGRSAIFSGGPQVAEVFYDVYHALEPGCAVVAENRRTGRIMGSCFYHPRKTHVALGIMNVHPNYFGHGVGRALVKYICDFTDQGGYKSLRLTSSALNLDSFSLYTRAGFVPRAAFQDMMVPVPKTGICRKTAETERVRDARAEDIAAIDALEREISGVSRDGDYRYFLKNELGFWHVSVYESPAGRVEGVMVSSGHPAFNMLGPCVAKTEEQALALILSELNHHKGRSPVFLVPVDRERLVREMYGLGARNCEIHLCQVRGHFTAFQGISMPTFLPDTA